MRDLKVADFFTVNGIAWAAATVFVAVAVHVGADAAPMHESLAAAAVSLEKHEYDQAIEAYQQAQIEAPHAIGIPYAIACSWFAKAEDLSGKDAESARTAYKSAQDAFQRVVDSVVDNDTLRAEARFGAANCVARAAELEAKPDEYLRSEDKGSVPLEEFKKRVETLRNGANVLDQYLAAYPNDERARRNADRMRYFWKKMLQERPKPKYGVQIINSATEYPQGNALPHEDEASVELRVGAQESGS